MHVVRAAMTAHEICITVVSYRGAFMCTLRCFCYESEQTNGLSECIASASEYGVVNDKRRTARLASK